MNTLSNRGRITLPEPEGVHCWRICVEEALGSRGVAGAAGVLSAEELRAAERFVREEDRERHVVARVALRKLAGRYLRCDPGVLGFEKGRFGKPALVLREGWPALTFNLAHSGGFVLIAFAVGRRIGVDVEKVRCDRDVMELARSQFSTAELNELETANAGMRGELFYKMWVLKEAYVKARGEGLNYPLANFTVKAGSAPEIVRALDDPEASRKWTAFEWVPALGYAGALVVEGRCVRLDERSWSPDLLQDL